MESWDLMFGADCGLNGQKTSVYGTVWASYVDGFSSQRAVAADTVAEQK